MPFPTPPKKPTGTILALDLGTTTGWALQTQYGEIVSGSKSFKPHMRSSGYRFNLFLKWLNETKTEHGPIIAVHFEQVRRHAGTKAAHIYGAFWGLLDAWCDSHLIPCHGTDVGTIKKHATGSGRADKAAMIEAARAKGFKPVDDNQADSLALLDYAVKVLGA